MDSRVKLYLERAEGEILLAKTNFEMSLSEEIKNTLNLPKEQTFFADVISESYYSIFYAAKAYLILKGIETKVPDEHKKTYKQFKKIVDSGDLDEELLEIYESEAEKADALLKILLLERGKRGRFTYDVNSNANIPYAEESIKNAREFVSVIKELAEKFDDEKNSKDADKGRGKSEENKGERYRGKSLS